jgi:PIN domain nuclease of toxin-antitoxin system
LAYLFGEPGADIAAGFIAGGTITSVTLAEVIAKLIDRGADPSDAAQQVAELPLQVISVDEGLGVAAGQLRSTTRALGLSIGDRVAIALALHARSAC